MSASSATMQITPAEQHASTNDVPEAQQPPLSSCTLSAADVQHIVVCSMKCCSACKLWHGLRLRKQSAKKWIAWELKGLFFLFLLLAMQTRIMTEQETNQGVMYLWSHAVPESVRQAIASGDKPFSLAGNVEVLKEVSTPFQRQGLAIACTLILAGKNMLIMLKASSNWREIYKF